MDRPGVLRLPDPAQNNKQQSGPPRLNGSHHSPFVPDCIGFEPLAARLLTHGHRASLFGDPFPAVGAGQVRRKPAPSLFICLCTTPRATAQIEPSTTPSSPISVLLHKNAPQVTKYPYVT